MVLRSRRRRLRLLRHVRASAAKVTARRLVRPTSQVPTNDRVRHGRAAKATSSKGQSKSSLSVSMALKQAARVDQTVQRVCPVKSAAAVPEGKDDRVEARDAMKRALPRYARINNLVPDLSWGRVQRELQASGFTMWRPSLQEKRSVAGKCINPDPPKSSGGMVYFRDLQIDDMLVFRPMGESQISRIEMLNKGSLVFQQKASAFTALALAPPQGAVVIDACAAPGSKTSQLASLMQNKGTVFAFDRDKRRLDTLAHLMQQRGATCVEPRNVDFLTVSRKDPKYAEVTHMLLDPSCSSSGMTTEPLSDEKTVAELALNQRKIILHAMQFPGVQRIAYSTCSVYEEENEEVVQQVLASPKGSSFQLAECLPWWPRRGHPTFPGAERCVRTSWDDQTIGFFVALFERKSSS